MNTPEGINKLIMRRFNQRNSDFIADKINRRANLRFNKVVNILTSTIEDKIESTDKEFLKYSIRLKDLQFIESIRFRYFIQNRLLSRIFDFVIDTSIPMELDIYSDISIRVDYQGITSIKNAKFIKNEDVDNLNSKFLELLNDELIIKRIISMQFSSIEINYSASKKEWNIKAISIIGSTSWLFLPPIFKTIEPSINECYMIIELFQLIASVLITEPIVEK